MFAGFFERTGDEEQYAQSEEVKREVSGKQYKI